MDVSLRGKTYRDSAELYDLNHTSLYRLIKNSKNNQNPVTMGYIHNFVFSNDEENTLADYLITRAAANYGLSTGIRTCTK